MSSWSLLWFLISWLGPILFLVAVSVCLSVCLSALQTSISFYLQQIQLSKCILPLGLSSLRIQWAYSFHPQMPKSWCNRYIDIDILSVTPLLDTVTLFLQDLEQRKLILPLGYPTSGIKWCHQFWCRMLGWWDIAIMNLIFWNISFADKVRVIKVNSTPRLSYLRWYWMQGCWDISFADNVRAIKVDSTPRISSLRN